MPEKPDLSYAFGLEPAGAIRYFEQLGFKVTWDWRETADAIRARAFAVSKSASLDILRDLKSGMVASLKSGGEREFLQKMPAILQAKGWWGTQEVETQPGVKETIQLGSPARLKTIYRTNAQAAFMAARKERFLATRETRPYWMYVAVMDAHTRPSHAAMHRQVFRWDDPIWEGGPPFGYNCRCRITSLSEAALKRSGVTVRSSEGSIVEELRPVSVDRDTGEALMETVRGYRVPPRPVRVAQKDSHPDSPIQVKKGQILNWPPKYDPKWADGDGPGWKAEMRGDVFHPDPGFGMPRGTWDRLRQELDRLPDTPRGPGGIPMSKGQRNYKDFDRPALRSVGADTRIVAPELLQKGKTEDEALTILATALEVSADRPLREIETPAGKVLIRHDLLRHVVEKRADARERYAPFVIPTLEKPFEVYLTRYEDGSLRPRYIGLFTGKRDVMVVVRINRDGQVVWNLMQADDQKMDGHRVGDLVWPPRK